MEGIVRIGEHRRCRFSRAIPQELFADGLCQPGLLPELIAELAHNSEVSEIEVAETAIALADEAARGSRRQRHVGFWLLDHGLNRAAQRSRLPRPLQAACTRFHSPLAAIFLSDRDRGSHDRTCRHFAGVAPIGHSYADGAVPADHPRNSGCGGFHEQPDELSGSSRASCPSSISTMAFRPIARPWLPSPRCC